MTKLDKTYKGQDYWSGISKPHTRKDGSATTLLEWKSQRGVWRAVLILAPSEEGGVRTEQALPRASRAGLSRSISERERCGLAPSMSDAGGNVILMTAERRSQRVGEAQKCAPFKDANRPVRFHP